jgi:hypothetical protein
MTLFHQSEVFALLVPALHRRAHITAHAVACERASFQTRISPRRRRALVGTLGQAARAGRNLLLALWGISALAFCLVVAAGFLR